ncbi:MAG: tRNA lysidine(34) synthetase TilS [Clostridiales bacterium]|nr:tRNA lysidine(34) synthetase TilS [Clostridiales bacterium]
MPLCDEFRGYIEKNQLFACDVVIVAVSGGPDSMCLLHLVISLSAEKDKTDPGTGSAVPDIVVAHVNHQLRGKASDDDEELVRVYCSDHGIEFNLEKADVSAMARTEGLGIEEAGRKARYAFFDEIAQRFENQGRTVRIAVAHRREDRAETMLMNLFRGAGTDGLCTMTASRGRIIRPLLFASREKIMEYVLRQDVPYSIDASNLENDYARNKWRNMVIPCIRKVAERDPIDALLSTAELLCTDRDFFDKRVAELFEKNKKRIVSGIFGLPCEVLRKSHPAIASRLVRYLFLRSFGHVTDLSKDRVEEILLFASENKGNRSVSLPGDRYAGFFADTLFFARQEEALFADIDKNKRTEPSQALIVVTCFGREYLVFRERSGEEIILGRDSLDRTGEVLFEKRPGTLFSVELKSVENPAQVVYNNRTWYCPMDAIDRVRLRTAKPSDRIRPAGGRGGKPLRRFLTDRKVPPEIRDRMVIAADEHEVLWIPGLAHAKGFVDAKSCARYLKDIGCATLFEDNSLPICRITLIPVSTVS